MPDTLCRAFTAAVLPTETLRASTTAGERPIHDDAARWAKVARAAGVKPD